MKVAQIARRLAEALHHHEDERQRRLAAELHVHPEVAEAAALAHDLGHPPFGHIAEAELQRLAKKKIGGEKPDSFEGNAQSFRIVTRLAVHRENQQGLNLSRATLRAILKYPWLRRNAPAGKENKWGAYETEASLLEFAAAEPATPLKSAEAEIMDWADDIAYSVHDLEDFYRAGALPLGAIALGSAETERFCDAIADTLDERDGRPSAELARAACRGVFQYASEALFDRYRGSQYQRGALRYFTSFLVGRFLRSFRLREPTEDDPRCFEVAPEDHEAVTVLKGLMRHYVFQNPALAAQQEGQKRVIRDLFRVFFHAAMEKKNRARDLLPWSAREYLSAELKQAEDPALAATRAVIDTISSMTEADAYAMHRRLRGIDPGRFADPIVL